MYANMVYGSTWEQGTCRVPSWTAASSANGAGNYGLSTGTVFSGRDTMGINHKSGDWYGLANRGICGGGMFFEAGQPYNVELVRAHSPLP